MKQLANQLIDQLEQNGFEAFYVGGCVRDWLLGRQVHDIDICTNAHPCDVARIFPDHIPTGLKHGTVSVKWGGSLFEVTTYRTESVYSDSRRPDEVVFVTDLTEDLSRRDFTMNAIAMSRSDELVDPFGGEQDIVNGIIRSVGDPATRFREDALRLLRAARFVAQLGFTIDDQTKQAMRETAPLLSRIAKERIHDELRKLIHNKFAQMGFEIVVQTSLLQAFPLLHDLFQGASKEAWRLPYLETLVSKWVFICYAAKIPVSPAVQICSQLRMSNKERESVEQLYAVITELMPTWDSPATIDWGRLLVRYGWDVCQQVEQLVQVIWWNNRDVRITQEFKDQYQQMPIHTMRELAINGLDLQQAFSRKAGEWIGRTLQVLLEQVALNQLPNTKEALLLAARKEVEKDEYQTGDSQGIS